MESLGIKKKNKKGNRKSENEKFVEEREKEREFNEDINYYLAKIYEPNLKNLLNTCYQCGSCSGVCQLSKVQKFTPSRIIQQLREGYEERVLKSEVLWDCLTCNNCLQNCPEYISFAEIVRNARYKMRKLHKQNPMKYISHEGIYVTISEMMSNPHLQPEKVLDWIPKDVEISNKGNIMYFVGCLPFFNFEFRNLNSIASSTLKMIYEIEKEPIVVLKEERCCGHDLFWGQGKFKKFINLAKNNFVNFEKTGVSTIITSCAECYRTLKIDYPKLFDDFNDIFEVKHIIEYIYEKWKENRIKFFDPNKGSEAVHFTYHDPCRLSRFLPEDNSITEKARDLFVEMKKIGYLFKEMEHNKQNSLCCGVNSWMNCNERTKGLRYKRLLEAKEVATEMITSCPKCRLHLSCLQDDYKDISSINIIDFSEFLVNLIEVVDTLTVTIE